MKSTSNNFNESLLANEDGQYRSQSIPGHEAYNKAFTFLIFIFPALGGLLFGYDIGGTSAALPSLKLYLGTDDPDSSYDVTINSIIVSFSLVGATLGSVAVFPIGDWLGRRRVIAVATFFYMLGAVTMIVSTALPWSTLTTVIVGRTLYGVGIGFCMHSAPIYIAELSPPKVRGFLISMKEAFVVVGILLGYLGGAIFSQLFNKCEKHLCWQWMYGSSLIFSVPLAIGLFFLPPSPRWLLLRSLVTSDTDLSNRARQIMRRARPTVSDHVLDEEIVEITDILTEQMGSSWGQLFNHKRELVIGCGLVFLQQVTGQPSVLYFASSIFELAGFTSSVANTTSQVGIGAFKLAMTAVAVFVVDRYGRRPLLLVGTTGLGVALVILGFALQFQDALGVVAGPLAITALMIYVGSYQMGFGPISWLMISEVFPLKVRTMAFAMATITNFGTNTAVAFTFLPIKSALGAPPLFWIYAGIAGFSVWFIYSLVPETKNKTLEEITRMLHPTKKVGALQEYNRT